MIIGVCGTFASGKDTVADYLAEKTGYFHISTGDLIRQYIRDNNLGEIDRDNLRKVANELRASKGSGYLVESSIKKYKDNLILSGIRSTGEAQALIAAGAHFVAVDAPIEHRYQWAKARGRIGDEITFDYFKKQELAETQNKGEHEQRINDVIEMAAYTVANDGSLEDLHTKLDILIERFNAEEQS